MRKLIRTAFLGCLFLAQSQGAFAASKISAPAVIVVDDFDQAYSSNHLGGAYGIVAEGGDARYEFIKPPIPYLANSSALKVTYKLTSSPGYAFLWMKLGKHQEAHELTDYLDLSQFVFLSFKYQSKQDVNFKIEIHEDIDGNNRFDVARDRVSSVYLDGVKKFPMEGGWTKVLLPLKRFNGIKDWSKAIEMVFVFEKDHSGTSGEILFEDLLFIRKSIQKKSFDVASRFFEKAKVEFNGTRAASDQTLQGENHIVVSYQPGARFEDLESLSLEIQPEDNGAWITAATEFNPGEKKTDIVWEAFSFHPPKNFSLRVTAADFFGNRQVIAGPFENIRVPAMTDEGFLDLVSRKAFLYFKENQNLENGLFYDTTGGGDLSTAVTGFGLSALVIGAERGWIDKSEAERRTKLCLESFLTKIPDKEGLYDHFLTAKTLKRAGNSEISTVDTALLLTGVLTAGEYFGGEIKTMAGDIYKKANWDYYLNKNEEEEHYMKFYHGWTPEENMVDSFWDYYTDETVLLNLLAIGSPTHPVPAEVYDKFVRRKGQYKNMKPFIYTWHGSLFSYQYASAWFDFRNLSDKDGVNWYENSKQATLSNREFVIDHGAEYKTYGPDTWGITSMRVPERYIMHYGPLPNGQNKAEHDGTISPSGPGGSMMFTPYLSLRALKHFYMTHPDLWGIYGFKDSINLDRYWISPIYYGLGEGIMLLSIENFRTGLIWKTFGKNEWVQKSLSETRFKKTPAKKKKEGQSIYAALKAEIDAGSETGRLDLIARRLDRPIPYADLSLLAEDLEKRYAASMHMPAIQILLGKVQTKLIQALQENDIALGRLYLKNTPGHLQKALRFFDDALKGKLSEVSRLEIYKEKIALLQQVMDYPALEETRNQLSQELQDGIKRQAYNLAWALKWAEQLDEETAFKLQRQFFDDLSPRERKILFEIIQRKTREAFTQGDYARASSLSEEQIHFMETPNFRRVLVGFLERTAKNFAEVQRYTEAERFYQKILEVYGDERDKIKILPVLASMFAKKGDKERAIKEYSRFAELFPKHERIPEVLNALANLESALGRREKAVALLTQVSENYPLTPQAEEASYLLGMVYFHSGQYADATRVWEKFLKDYPNSRRLTIIQDYLERADKKEAGS